MVEVVVKQLSLEVKSAPCEVITRTCGYIVGTARLITIWCNVLYVGRTSEQKLKCRDGKGRGSYVMWRLDLSGVLRS